jgi:serine/threonine-protein kinase
VYVGRESNNSILYLQDLVTGEVKRLPETSGADTPAFSPDGRTIGFTAGGTIKVLPIDGLPRDIPGIEGLVFDWDWSGPAHVVVAGQKGLVRFPVAGGSPEVIAPVSAGEALFSSVTPLPAGGYAVAVRATTSMDDASRVVMVSSGESNRVVIAEQGGSPAFIAAEGGDIGHIVFGRGGRLMAVPFDARRRVVLGSAVPVVENVAMRPNGDWAAYSVAGNGLLIYREATLHELVWVERGSQSVRPASANHRRFAMPRFSPDGRRVAMEVQDSPHQIWMLDIERDLLTPLTTDVEGAHNFAWSPDGAAIVYTLGNVKPPQLGWIRTTGAPSPARIEIPADIGSMVDDWSRDNRLLVIARQPPPVMTALSLSASAPAKAGTSTKITTGLPGSFSPDGAWVTYCDCWDTARRQSNVFIRHLRSGGEFQVSVQGGSEPSWGPNGQELFFRNGSKMMAVPLTFDGENVKIGRAETLFEGEYLEWSSANYDVTRDGKKFLMVRATTSDQRSLAVRLNWTGELAKLAPLSR